MSGGLFACPVESEPSWPVVIACSMSSASPPRHSPTMIRSGRMWSALRSRSRIVISPVLSRFGGRDSSVTTCTWRSCSSAASSIVMIRSSSGMNDDMTLRVVVLPDPVPPETKMFRRASTQALQEVEHLGGRGAEADQVVDRERPGGELADRDHRPNQRERLDDRVDPRPVGEPGIHPRAHRVDPPSHRGDDPVDDPEHVLVAQEGALDTLDLPVPLDVDVVGAVDHDLGDGLVAEERLKRPEARQIVGHLLDQAPALVAGHDQPARVHGSIDDRLDPGAHVRVVPGLAQRVVRADQLVVETGPDLAKGILPPGRGGWPGRRRPDGHEGAGVGDVDPALRPLDPLEQRHSVPSVGLCRHSGSPEHPSPAMWVYHNSGTNG